MTTPNNPRPNEIDFDHGPLPKVGKARRRLSYVVPPLLVTDLVTQCAAHYLVAFKASGSTRMSAVFNVGLHGPGGIVDDIDRWFQECSSAVRIGGLGGWDAKNHGPWVYDDLVIMDIAAAVQRHTRGWALQDFAAYGELVNEARTSPARKKRRQECPA